MIRLFHVIIAEIVRRINVNYPKAVELGDWAYTCLLAPPSFRRRWWLVSSCENWNPTAFELYYSLNTKAALTLVTYTSKYQGRKTHRIAWLCHSSMSIVWMLPMTPIHNHTCQEGCLKKRIPSRWLLYVLTKHHIWGNVFSVWLTTKEKWELLEDTEMKSIHWKSSLDYRWSASPRGFLGCRPRRLTCYTLVLYFRHFQSWLLFRTFNHIHSMITVKCSTIGFLALWLRSFQFFRGKTSSCLSDYCLCRFQTPSSIYITEGFISPALTCQLGVHARHQNTRLCESFGIECYLHLVLLFLCSQQLLQGPRQHILQSCEGLRMFLQLY